MNNIEKIVKGIADLMQGGSKLLQDGLKEDMSLGEFGPRYEM